MTEKEKKNATIVAEKEKEIALLATVKERMMMKSAPTAEEAAKSLVNIAMAKEAENVALATDKEQDHAEIVEETVKSSAKTAMAMGHVHVVDVMEKEM